MRLILMVTLGFLLLGCANSKQLNNVSLGMNKSSVIAIMGNPERTSAQSPHEYFIYELSTGLNGKQAAGCAVGTLLVFGVGECFESDSFYVRFENGVVESYGRVGDFDSTNVPEATINVNRN
jgi:hypothetical protein